MFSTIQTLLLAFQLLTALLILRSNFWSGTRLQFPLKNWYALTTINHRQSTNTHVHAHPQPACANLPDAYCTNYLLYLLSLAWYRISFVLTVSMICSRTLSFVTICMLESSPMYALFLLLLLCHCLQPHPVNGCNRRSTIIAYAFTLSRLISLGGNI